MRTYLGLVVILAFANASGAGTMVDYGWEDEGTVLGVYPDPDLPSLIATCVSAEDGNQVFSGSYSLRLEMNESSGHATVFLAFVWNLVDGNEIFAHFWRYDDTPASFPHVRITAHWNDGLPADPYRDDGPAGGNEDYGPGEGWDQSDWHWVVSGGHTGAVIEARVDGAPGDVVWIDDFWIDVWDDVPPEEADVCVQIPGDSPVATRESTLTEVRALFR
jgi:hypothetical protein